MSDIANAHDVRELEEFYKRWSSDVFVFGRLFLGNEAEAEQMVSQAFLAFYRESSTLPVMGEVPPRLIGLAFQAMQPCRAGPDTCPSRGSLEHCILHLDCRQRAVFIARNVLGMGWPQVAGATGFSVQEARQLWMKGMFGLRELLPRDFFER